MENYQKNYINTDRPRSVANPSKLKSKILPQSDLVVDNSPDLDDIVNAANDHPRNCNIFEILSDRDLDLSESNDSSDDDRLSYASVLSKGSTKKSIKPQNNKKPKVKRKINVDSEVGKLDFSLDYFSGDSYGAQKQEKFREKKRTFTRNENKPRQEVKKDEFQVQKSKSTNIIVRIIKEVLNFYRKPSKTLDMYIDFILQIVEELQDSIIVTDLE